MLADRSKPLSYTLWIVSLMQVCYCWGEFCPLEQSNCSQFGVSCTVKRSGDCLTRRLGTPSPGPVRSLDVRIRYQDLSSTQTRITTPSLQVSWKLPANDTHKYLSGFELSIRSVDNKFHACIIYDISDPVWQEPPSVYQFQYIYSCASLPEGQYNIEVRSVPHSAFSDVKATAMIRVLGRDTACGIDQASCWKTDIVAYIRPCDKRLRVQFQIAPDETRISEYLVTLINKDSFFPDVSATILHDSGKTTGYVVLNITGRLPLYERIITVRPGGEVCGMNNCLISSTVPFNITSPTDEECIFNSSSLPPDASTKPATLSTTLQRTRKTFDISTEEDCTINCSISPGTHPGLTKAAVTGLIITSLFFSGVLIAIIISVSKKHRENIRRDSQLPRKTIYMVYSYDNEYHQEVIEHLVHFLESVCYCNVIYDKRFPDQVSDSSLWVINAIQRSDRMLLVTSEGSYRRSLLIQNKEIPPTTDTFTQVYKLLEEDMSQGNGSLMNKLILVHFSYTPPQYRVIGICPLLRHKVNHRLMEDIVQVYRLIHGSVNKHIVSSLSKHKDKLSRYIDSASRYVQFNPNWFTDYYGNPSANSDAITLGFDNINYTRSNGLTNLSPPAGYTNLSVVPPSIPDDNATITSSVLCDMVDDINIH